MSKQPQFDLNRIQEAMAKGDHGWAKGQLDLVVAFTLVRIADQLGEILAELKGISRMPETTMAQIEKALDEAQAELGIKPKPEGRKY